MKKFLVSICGILGILVCVYFIPRVYERLLPVDRTAAVALAALDRDEVGKQVVACLNQRNDGGVWWHFLMDWNVKAHEDSGGVWSDTHYVITGRIGWSVTWAAILPLDGGTLTAFETYGAVNGGDGAIHRAKLPARIIGSFKRCGVAYGGVYPDVLLFD